jgi:hypothetical protein
VKRDATFLAPFAVDLQHLVPAAGAVIAHAQGHELADPAGRVGQECENRSIPQANRGLVVRSAEKPPAVRGGDRDGLAVPWNGGGLDEVAVRGVGSEVSVALEVRKERTKGRHLAADRAVRQPLVPKLVPPGCDLLRPYLDQPAELLERNAQEIQELVDVERVVRAGVSGRGPKKPGLEGLGDVPVKLRGARGVHLHDRERRRKKDGRILGCFFRVLSHRGL